MDFDMNIEKAGDQTAKVTLTDKSGKVTVNIPEATIIALDGYTLRGQGTATINDNVTKATENANTMTVDFTAKISADYREENQRRTEDCRWYIQCRQQHLRKASSFQASCNLESRACNHV